jgi:ABC-type transport system substrate-binding protein/streptogramin lyase
MRSPAGSGTVIAGFRIESPLGEGAMGAVYLARKVDDGQHVALKLLVPELARDERFRQRFLRESELAKNLDHPNIVPTLGSGEHDRQLYLAMTYVKGSDLRRIIQREGSLDSTRAIELVRQVAEALDAAHAAGLVHRDVKPANILVGAHEGKERAYVCDFGLARHVSSVSSLTSDRGFVGTIDYVPPEQIEGGEIDRRADVYSLGCVLFECLAGERPFDRDSELSVLFAHLNEPAPPITDFRPELPQALDGVFEIALAKSPDDRFRTCGELVEAALAALSGKAFARKRAPQRHRFLLAAVGAAAVGAVLAAVLASGGPGAKARAPTVNLRPNALTLVDARTHRVVSQITSRFGAPPWDVVFVGRSAWMLVGGAQRLERVDLRTRKLAQVVHLPFGPGGRIALGRGLLWLTQDGGSGVMRVDAHSGKVLPSLSIRGQGAGITYGAGSLWLTRDSSVVRIAPRDGEVIARIGIPSGPAWLSFADGAVWVAGASDGFVGRIDPADDRITIKARLRGWLTDLVVGGGFVWASISDGTIFKLSDSDLSIQDSFRGLTDPERITFGGGHLWIANTATRRISWLAPNSVSPVRLAASSAPSVVRYHNRLLWAGAGPVPPPLPPIAGQQIRISTPSIFTDADPSTARLDEQNQQLFYAVCANLLNYPDARGAEGARLRPELATAMPTVSSDRRTYTFHIRRGVRFSPPSNELVTAATFRHTFERALSPKLQGPPGAQLASDIVGVRAFRAGRAAHISGISARGNTLSFTLRRPSGDFLERISMFTFCPVPRSQRVVPSGLTGPIPSLGPYYPFKMNDAYTVLLRNPNYVGSRPRRSARIVFSFGTPTPQAVADANKGKTDLLPGDFDQYSPLAPGGLLDRSYGPRSSAAAKGDQRYFREPAPYVRLAVLNTGRPLFRSARLRRAVSYAIDRSDRSVPSTFEAGPADQIVPPAVRGFPAGRIYPLAGPNLAEARRLAGHRSRHAILYAPCGFGDAPIAALIRSDLAKIRIKVSIVTTQACPSRYTPRSKRADLLLAGLGSPLLSDPEPFFDQALARGRYGSTLGPGPWNTHAFRARVDRARALAGPARIAAYSRLDTELMRAAPIVVFGTFVYQEFVSPKVGCRLFQGAYGFLDLGALCLRGP